MLALVLLIIFALTYYLLVGLVIFKLIFSRRSVKSKALKKDSDGKLKQHKIDLCWWEAQKFSRVEIKSFDGLKLCGFFKSANSNKTVLILHGFGGSHLDMQPYCKFFCDKNFNVLCVDNRTHGQSEGNFIGFGWLDRKDVCSWVQYLNEKYPDNKILLFGLSMGATAVCMASGESLQNVMGIVSDCAFDNADREISFVLKKKKMFLKIIQKHLYSFALRVYGFDIKQADSIKMVKNTKVPILYIHGAEDELVPVQNAYNLFGATPQNLRELMIVDDATHARSYAVAGVLYEKKISDFLKSRTIIGIEN